MSINERLLAWQIALDGMAIQPTGDYNMREKIEIKCLGCEKVITAKRRWQKFCSTQCRNDHYWRTHKIVKIEDK